MPEDINESLEKRTEYDVFNVANGYTIYKILKPLVLIDQYEIIAQYGAESIDDNLDLNSLPMRRKEAFSRLISQIYLLLTNMKIEPKIHNSVTRVERILKGIQTQEYNIFRSQYNSDNQRELIIDEYLLDTNLSKIRTLKKIINSLLKSSGLLFKKTESQNLEDIKKEFIRNA